VGFIDAGVQARLDRYIGYYEPYASSHDSLDRDEAVHEEARNVARAGGEGRGRVAIRPTAGGAAESVASATEVSSSRQARRQRLIRFHQSWSLV